MKNNANKKLTRFEVSMGVALMIAVGLALYSPVRGLLNDEPDQRAGTLAEELAHALVDYRQESGSWPAKGASGTSWLDLSALAREKTPVQAADAGTSSPWTDAANRPLVEEVPLDPWEKPFRAFVLAGGSGVAVLSAGPNGQFETPADLLWSRRGQEFAFNADDAGFILVFDEAGGNR